LGQDSSIVPVESRPFRRGDESLFSIDKFPRFPYAFPEKMKTFSALILGICILVAAVILVKMPRAPQALFSSPPQTLVVGEAEQKRDFSDLVLVEENTYLIVSDYKMPIHPGHRVSLLTVAEEATRNFPIPVADWRDADLAPSDLEACCPVPGRADEYLLAESGAFNGKFGRIFHVTLHEGNELTPAISVNGVMRIYDRPLDEKQRAFGGDQVEGIAAFLSNGEVILVCGERGGETSGGTKTGTLFWGELDLDEYHFTRLGESPICRKPILGGRDCGSLQLIARKDGSHSVIAVATNDPGEGGPFESILYLAGKFDTNESGKVRFAMADEPVILSRLSGLKVEGIARPPKAAPEATFAISTDDEAFGAIVRPVRIRENF
jgi:hypothetical protein